jgi:transcription initiation factor TFIIB
MATNMDDYNMDIYSTLIDEMYNENTIDKNKNCLWCYKCNNDNIIEDTSHGNIVCAGCGDIISNLVDSHAEWRQYDDDNKGSSNRCSLPISKLLPQSSSATSIGGCSSRVKTLHAWSLVPYNERSLKEVFDKIEACCEMGNIEKCIQHDAKITYKLISDCKHTSGKNIGKKIIIRGKNRNGLIAACILNACKKKFKTRSPKEIAKIFNLDYTDITKGCKLFKKLAKLKQIDCKLSPSTPEQFISRFCDELKIKREYTVQAIKIASNVQKLAIAAVHTPLSLATGSIYLMINLNNLNITKKTIADKFDVSQVTISKAFKKLEPFINILINDDVCDKIGKYIKLYQENIIIDNNLKTKFIRFDIDTVNIDTVNIDTVNINTVNIDTVNVDRKYDMDGIADKRGNYDINGIFDVNSKYDLNSKFNVYDEFTNSINEKLIINQSIEIDNKINYLDNKFIKLSLDFVDMIYLLSI